MVFKTPVLVIGNLTVGGTGKTPHVEYLASQLSHRYNVALLSRGYGRKTKGFLEINRNSTAAEVGDEPKQMFLKSMRGVNSFVGENRVQAIGKIREIYPKKNLYILDDAFQHFQLNASTYILLTDYKRLFYKDYIMPSGLLRESKYGAQRADIILVTKCPNNLSDGEKQVIKSKIGKYSKAPIWFSEMEQAPYVGTNQEELVDKDVVVLSAIAQNDSFIESVRSQKEVIRSFSFLDHHNFSVSEIEQVVNYCQENDLPLVTTEKDFVRLSNPEFSELISKIRIFVAPIKVRILEDERPFWDKIEDEIKKVQ